MPSMSIYGHITQWHISKPSIVLPKFGSSRCLSQWTLTCHCCSGLLVWHAGRYSLLERCPMVEWTHSQWSNYWRVEEGSTNLLMQLAQMKCELHFMQQVVNCVLSSAVHVHLDAHSPSSEENPNHYYDKSWMEGSGNVTTFKTYSRFSI